MPGVDRDGLCRSSCITHAWVGELDRRLGWNDAPRSYRLLKAVLYAVCEGWPAGEAIDPPRLLPLRLCGTRYEHWRTSVTPSCDHSSRHFVTRVALWFKPDPLDNAPVSILSVLDYLSEKLSLAEAAEIRSALPVEFQRAWAGDDVRPPNRSRAGRPPSPTPQPLF